jgi:hypothetical protein
MALADPRQVELLLLLGPYSAWRGEVVMAGVYSDGGLPHISIPLLYSQEGRGGEGKWERGGIWRNSSFT